MPRRALVIGLLLAAVAAATVAVALRGRAPVAAPDADGPTDRRAAEPRTGAPRAAPPPLTSASAPDAPAAEAPFPAPCAADEWVVTCLDGGGEPIPGVTLKLPDVVEVFAETGIDGRACFTPPANKRPLRIGFGGTVDGPYRDVSGPATTVRFDDTLPLDVTVIDASTGSPVPGASVALRRHFGADPWPLRANGVTHHLAASPANRGEGFQETFDVTPPPGLAAPGIYFTWFRQRVSGAASRVRMQLPVWPAGTVRVRVLEHDGAPAQGPVTLEPSISYADLERRTAEPDDAGWVEIGGVPVVPSAAFRVDVAHGKRKVTSDVLRLAATTRAYETTVTLPETPARGAGFGCGGGSGVCVREAMEPSSQTTLDIVALRRDGRPARNCRVVVSGLCWKKDRDDGELHGRFWEHVVRTGDDGRASVRGIPVGNIDDPSAASITVELLETGVTPTEVEIEVERDDRRSVEIREPEGASLVLTVVDEAGLPVEWAYVKAVQPRTFGDWNWAALDGEVQDLTPRTDAAGNYVLTGLPPGEIEVECAFAFVRAKAKFRTGEPARLVIAR